MFLSRHNKCRDNQSSVWVIKTGGNNRVIIGTAASDRRKNAGGGDIETNATRLWPKRGRSVALPLAQPDGDRSPNEDHGGDVRAVQACCRAKKWSDTHNINNIKLTILFILILIYIYFFLNIIIACSRYHHPVCKSVRARAVKRATRSAAATATATATTAIIVVDGGRGHELVSISL